MGSYSARGATSPIYLHLPQDPMLHKVRPGIFHSYQTVRKRHAVGLRICTPEHTLKGKQAFQGYREKAHSIVGEFGTVSGERVEGRGPVAGIQKEVEPGVEIECPQRLYNGLLPTEARGTTPKKEPWAHRKSYKCTWRQESVFSEGACSDSMPCCPHPSPPLVKHYG